MKYTVPFYATEKFTSKSHKNFSHEVVVKAGLDALPDLGAIKEVSNNIEWKASTQDISLF